MPFLSLHYACVCQTSDMCVLICKPSLTCLCASFTSQAVQCRDTRSAQQQSPGHHTQVNGKGLSLHSPSTTTNLIQVTGHEQWRSVYIPVCYTAALHPMLHLWFKPEAACHGCAYLHCIFCTAPLQNVVCCVLPLCFVLANACCTCVNGVCIVLCMLS